MLVGFLEAFTEQAVGREWAVTDLSGGAGERTKKFLLMGNCFPHMFNNLYSSPNIIRMVKSRRMKLAGYVTRTGKSEMHIKF
jgi:hypothetical protein